MNSLSDYLMTWRSWREAMDLNRRITFDFCLQTILFAGFFLVLEMLLASMLAAGILAVGVLLLVGLLIGLIRGVSRQGIAASFLALMYLSLGAMVVLSGGHSVAALIVLPVLMFMVVLLLPGQQVTWIWAALILPIPLLAMILLQLPAEYPIMFPPEWRQTSILGISLLLILYVQLVGRAYRASIDEARREVDQRIEMWRRESDHARISEHRFRDFADEAANILWETDENRRITFLSLGFETLFEISIDDCIGLTLGEIFQRYTVEQSEPEQYSRQIDERRDFRHQRLLWRLKDGRTITVLNSGQPVYDEGGGFRGYRGVIQDITDAEAIRKELEHRASRDPLTGLENRRAFVSQLAQRLKISSEERRAIALAFVDLDHFKAVNDSGGHAVGDELLCGIADVLNDAAGRDAIIARIGGDEFCILWTAPQPTALRRLGEQVAKAVSGYRLLRGGAGYGVGCSIGIAWQQPVTISDEDAWLVAADAAAYAAKNSGRGRVKLITMDSNTDSPNEPSGG